ncbi:MAG: CRTAC1 family protein [Candidatus Omnitrophota bacterium]
MRKFCCSASFGFTVFFCLLCAAVHGQEIVFTDVTDQSGVTFRHYDGSTGRKFVMETTCSGLGLFDYDNDGFLDIYFVNGAILPGASETVSPPDVLYRNNGDLTFTDVTEKAGVGDRNYGYGCVAGDYDNDGDLDLYVVNFGPNKLFRNNGGGTFTDVAKQAGVDDPRQGAAAVFFDIDNDGDLDLYVTNYLKVDIEKNQACFHGKIPIYCSRLEFAFEKDILYRNNGDGTFADATKEAGMDVPASTGMSVVTTDYDNDGWQDLFVVNDARPNYMFHNLGKGKFEEVGLYTGVAYDLNGASQGNMGADFRDYDDDGFIDLISTNYQQQMVAVYRNLGGVLFQDVCLESQVGPPTTPYVTWGVGFYDFNNDGMRDSYIAAGHLQDNIETYDKSTSYENTNFLFIQRGKGVFEDVSDRSGPGLLIRKSSRGCAFGDLDNDGDIDIVVTNARNRADILRNDSKNKNHWIQIRTVGVQSNRDGVGARISVTANGKTRIDDVRAGGSYASMNDPRVHFGLGQAERIDEIKIQWPSGKVDVLKNIAADCILSVTEGRL